MTKEKINEAFSEVVKEKVAHKEEMRPHIPGVAESNMFLALWTTMLSSVIEAVESDSPQAALANMADLKASFGTALLVALYVGMKLKEHELVNFSFPIPKAN